jgi:tRNA-Thr(GGU) m(6)t(6)A37 methyltransferase TsaA
LKCEPVGVVRRSGVPREAEGREEVFKHSEELMRSEAKIEIFEPFCEALEGLRKGSLVWVIWYAHLAEGRPVKVRPYRDPSMPELGVFATRSPARPCPLGLSLVYVTEVGNCYLKVKGLDAYDGTPVLDLKLYYEGLDSPREVLSRV